LVAIPWFDTKINIDVIARLALLFFAKMPS